MNENRKPVTPAEFYALCRHFSADISPYDMDRAYSMLSDYMPPPSSPTQALMVVQVALLNIGVNAIL